MMMMAIGPRALANSVNSNQKMADSWVNMPIREGDSVTEKKDSITNVDSSEITCRKHFFIAADINY